MNLINSKSIPDACEKFAVIRPTIRRATKYGIKVIHHMYAMSFGGHVMNHIFYVRFPDTVQPVRLMHEELKSKISDYAVAERMGMKHVVIPVEKVERKYNIPVTRIGYSYRVIEVTATSQEEAEQKALDEAGNYDYSEKDADYKVVY